MTATSRLVGRLARLRPPEHEDVGVERDLAMTADDGAVLLADRWAPSGVPGAPLVLLRSPYGRRTLDLVGRLLAERGYQVIIQSVRGTFGSGGRWEPFRHERADGAATLRWLAAQPWWPGVVGTFGPSYLGLTQWALAAAAPDGVQAMALSVTSSAFRHAVVYLGGTFTLETGATWMNLLEHQEGGWRRALRAQLRSRRGLGPAYTALPLSTAEAAILGRTIEYYQDWLEHERPGDPWWDEIDFGRDVRRMPPVSMVAGWFDIFLPYQLDDYDALRAAGRPVRLTIGPWTHSSLRLSAAALADGLDWFDRHLGGRDGAAGATIGGGQEGAGPVVGGASRWQRAPRGAARGARPARQAGVRLRLVGRRRWVEIPEWPPPADTVRWYLHGDGGLRRAAPPRAPAARYRWDPAHPTPGVGGASLNPANAGRRNQRRREERADVRTWTSDPMPAGLVLAGPVAAEIWLRSSNWHTDLFARLCTVSPSGRSRNLSDGILRLEPGEEGRVITLGTAADGEVTGADDGVVRVRIRMWPIGIEVRAGHRLRLQVSGGAHPLVARNLGGGERLGSATRMVPADHDVFQDPEHPSALLLSHALLA